MTIATGTIISDVEIYVDEEDEAPVEYCDQVVFVGNHWEPMEYCENEAEQGFDKCRNHRENDDVDYFVYGGRFLR